MKLDIEHPLAPGGRIMLAAASEGACVGATVAECQRDAVDRAWLLCRNDLGGLTELTVRGRRAMDVPWPEQAGS